MLASLILYPTWLNVGDKAWQLATAALVGLIRMLETGDRSIHDEQVERPQNARRAVDGSGCGVSGLEPVGSLSHSSERALALAGGRSQSEVTAQL
jgi:hypothetical protein